MGDAQQLRRSEPADGYHWPVPPASRDRHKVQEGGDERTGVVGESEQLGFTEGRVWARGGQKGSTAGEGKGEQMEDGPAQEALGSACEEE